MRLLARRLIPLTFAIGVLAPAAAGPTLTAAAANPIVGESGNRHDRLADRGTTGERHHRPDQGLCLGDERQPEPEHQVLCQRLPPANLLDRFLSDWLVRRTGWTPSPQCSCLTLHPPGSLRPECFDPAD